MGIPNETQARFFAGQRTDHVRFVIHDTVIIKEGERAGTEAAVISITALDPEVTFLVEPLAASYGDIELPQSVLQLAGGEACCLCPPTGR